MASGMYMIDQDDAIRNGSGGVDAELTLNTPQGDGAYGMSYGTWIGATISPALAPFISLRVNDNPTESKRSNFCAWPRRTINPKVRPRFMQAGTGSWHFGHRQRGSIQHQPGSGADRASRSYQRGRSLRQRRIADNFHQWSRAFTYQWQRNGLNIAGAAERNAAAHECATHRRVLIR